jgi:hypothetical protein
LEKEDFMLIAFLMFCLSCSSESQSTPLGLSLQINRNQTKTQTNFSSSQPISLHELLQMLSPFWKKQTKSEFAIRSYSRPFGVLADPAYVGGVYDPLNNQIVFVPHSQGSQIEWHVYDCKTQTVLAYPKPTGTILNSAYNGGVYDPINQQIVFVPFVQASQAEWHVYDCATKTVLAYPKPIGPLADGAYWGGVYDPLSQQIVFVPFNQAPRDEWHVYDCATKTILSYPRPAPAAAFVSNAYIGGVYDPTNNQIVFVPAEQAAERSEWHVYDCATKTLLSYPRPGLSHEFGWLRAYSGGVYDPLNNQIVFIPWMQAGMSNWHVYDCSSKTAVAYPRLTTGNGSYSGGVYDPINNQIVFAPSHQELQWHLYDCTTKTVLAYPRSQSLAANAYNGAVYDPTNNQVVFVPFGQGPQPTWDTFQNLGSPQIDRHLAAHYLFNKY